MKFNSREGPDRNADTGLARRILGFCAFLAALLAAGPACAAATYDGIYLALPQLRVGSTTYANVKVAIASVVSVEADRANVSYADGSFSLDAVDTYQPANNLLVVSNLQAFGTVYTRVVLSVGDIVSVGGVIGSTLGVRTEAYAAPGGSDTNPGTLSQPFRTAQLCANALAPGGTCYLRGGTYGETITPLSGTTIAAYGGEAVTIDGTDAIDPAGWRSSGGSIYATQVGLGQADTNQTSSGAATTPGTRKRP